MGLKIRDIKRVELNTSSNSTQLAYSIPTSSNSNILIEITAIGRRIYNQNSYVCKIIELFKNVSGTVSKIGSTVTIFSEYDTNMSNCSLTTNINSTDIEVIVTGTNQDGTLTINWEAEIKISVN